jgi:hypothetical protein
MFCKVSKIGYGVKSHISWFMGGTDTAQVLSQTLSKWMIDHDIPSGNLKICY